MLRTENNNNGRATKKQSAFKEVFRRLRKNKGAQNIDDVQIPDPRKSIEERAADKDQAMAVHRVLHDMPEPYKEVFTLRIFGQLAFNDIGRLFGRSANWACVTYHRACQKIQSEMEEEK